MGSLAYKPRRNTDKTDSESVALMHCEHASLTSADFTTSDVHNLPRNCTAAEYWFQELEERNPGFGFQQAHGFGQFSFELVIDFVNFQFVFSDDNCFPWMLTQYLVVESKAHPKSTSVFD